MAFLPVHAGGNAMAHGWLESRVWQFVPCSELANEDTRHDCHEEVGACSWATYKIPITAQMPNVKDVSVYTWSEKLKETHVQRNTRDVLGSHTAGSNPMLYSRRTFDLNTWTHCTPGLSRRIQEPRVSRYSSRSKSAKKALRKSSTVSATSPTLNNASIPSTGAPPKHRQSTAAPSLSHAQTLATD